MEWLILWLACTQGGDCAGWHQPIAVDTGLVDPDVPRQRAGRRG